METIKLKAPTYQEYLIKMNGIKAQPVKEETFNSLIKAGFDPVKNEWPHIQAPRSLDQ